jgi:outer membrane protein insertion porin family
MHRTLWLAVPLLLVVVGRAWATEPVEALESDSGSRPKLSEALGRPPADSGSFDESLDLTQDQPVTQFSPVSFDEEPQAGGQRPGNKSRDIGRIRVEGTIRVEEEAIHVRIGSQVGEVLDEAKVDQDIRSIYEIGFFSNVEVHLSQEQEQLVLIYRVQERPVIKSISIEGNDVISKDSLEDALNIHPRIILNPIRIRQGLEEIKKKYEEKGYVDTQVSYKTERTVEGEVALTFIIDERAVLHVEEVTFEGNKEFSDSELRGVMATRKRNWLSRFLNTGVLDNEVLKTDTERLTAFYYDHGYIDVNIDDPRVKREPDGLHITIRVDERDQYKVGEITFDDDVPGGSEMPPMIVSFKEDEVFRASQLREDIMRLTSYFSDMGYAFVNVEPKTQLRSEDKKVDVAFQVDPGPEVFIDRVKITGNSKTRDKVIRREVQVNEWDRFSAVSLQRSRARVQRLGYFEQVNVTTQQGSREDRLSVLVDVKESQTGAFSIGAGFNSATSLIGSAGIRENNLFGRGQRAVLTASLGSIYRNTQLSLTDPYFLDTYLTAGFELYDWRFEFEDFDRSGTGGTVRFFYPLAAMGIYSLWGVPTQDVQLGFVYEYQRAEISDFDFYTPEAIFSEAGKETISSAAPTILRNNLNHSFDPTDGSLQQVSFEYGGLGGTTDFIKLETEGRWFFPVYRSPLGMVTMMTGGFLGYGFGDKSFRSRFKDSVSGEEFFGSQVLKDDLPLFERYFPGGIDSIRGFGERSLGPREPAACRDPETGSALPCNLAPPGAKVIDTDPIGGSIELILNNELMVPIAEPLGLKGLVFFDAGNAFTREQGIELSEMRYSVGTGVRWKSPFGPIRIELARALNAKSDERTSNLHFSFGGFGGIGKGGRRRGVPF